MSINSLTFSLSHYSKQMSLNRPRRKRRNLKSGIRQPVQARSKYFCLVRTVDYIGGCFYLSYFTPICRDSAINFISLWNSTVEGSKMDTKVRNSTVKMWAIKMASSSDSIWEAKHTKDCLLVLVIAVQKIYIPKSNSVFRPICAYMYASKKANVQSPTKRRILISEIAGCSFSDITQ